VRVATCINVMCRNGLGEQEVAVRFGKHFGEWHHYQSDPEMSEYDPDGIMSNVEAGCSFFSKSSPDFRSPAHTLLKRMRIEMSLIPNKEESRNKLVPANRKIWKVVAN